MSYSPTLVEAAKFITNDINRAVALDIIDLDPMFSLIPTVGIAGQVKQVNREDDLGGAEFIDVNEAIPAGAKAAATFEPVTYGLKSVVSDVVIDGLVRATSSAGGDNIEAKQMRAKAKQLGRKLRHGLAQGTGVGAYQLNSLRSMADATQSIDVDGAVFSFELLDELMLKARSKSSVDFLVLPETAYLKFQALMRQAGGITPAMIGGKPVLVYGTVPVFLNEFLSTTETAAGVESAGATLYSIYAGCFDDGTEATGLAMLHPDATPAGISSEYVGISDGYDQETWRLKAYVNFAMLNRRGLARAFNIAKTA
jgi:hypothetical protein